MDKPTQAPSLQQQIDAIEQRMARLLTLIEKLSSENSELRKQEKALSRECQDLRTRNDKASQQLAALIQRLKNQAHEV